MTMGNENGGNIPQKGPGPQQRPNPNRVNSNNPNSKVVLKRRPMPQGAQRVPSQGGQRPVQHAPANSQHVAPVKRPDETVEDPKPQIVADTPEVKNEVVVNNEVKETEIVTQNENTVTSSDKVEVKHNSSFNVSMISYFFQRFGMFLLNVLTLGIATLGNDIRYMKFLAANAIIDGYHIKFNGKKRQLRRKYNAWRIKSVLTLGFYKYYEDINFEKWKVKHTKFVDKSQREGSSSFEGKTSEWLHIYFKCWALKWLTLGLLNPLSSFYKCEYFVNNTYVNGKQLHYDRTKQEVMDQLKKDILFSFLTLGIYGWLVVPYNTLKNDLAHIYLAEGCMDGAMVAEEKETVTLKSVSSDVTNKMASNGGVTFIISLIVFLIDYFLLEPNNILSDLGEYLYLICGVLAIFGIVCLVYALFYFIAYKIVSKRLDSTLPYENNVVMDYSNPRGNKKFIKEQFVLIKDKIKDKQKLNEQEAIINFMNNVRKINKAIGIVLVILVLLSSVAPVLWELYLSLKGVPGAGF